MEAILQRLFEWLTGIIALVLASFIPSSDAGFVEIRTFPASATTPFYLDATQVERSQSGSIVLKQSVGTRKLQVDGFGGKLTVVCELVVKKNRITTVTVSLLDRPPQCQCRDLSGIARPSSRVCLG